MSNQKKLKSGGTNQPPVPLPNLQQTAASKKYMTETETETDSALDDSAIESVNFPLHLILLEICSSQQWSSLGTSAPTLVPSRGKSPKDAGFQDPLHHLHHHDQWIPSDHHYGTCVLRGFDHEPHLLYVQRAHIFEEEGREGQEESFQLDRLVLLCFLRLPSNTTPVFEEGPG